MTMKKRGLLKDLERNLTGYQEKRDNMNVLEKILEEIEDVRKIMKSTVATNCFGKECENDDCTVCVCERVIEIIRSHMEEVNDTNVPSDWIPCSERLPEKPVFGEDSYIVQTNNIITPFSAFWDGEEWTDVSDDKVKGVIAWQPLPKRYKGK